MIKKYFINLICLALIFTAFDAYASKIALSTVIVDFNAKNKKSKRFIDVVVTNISENETAYVEVKVNEILNPGTDDEKRVEVEKGAKDSLIVSPQKMVIPPKAKKSLRFVTLHKDLKKDKIYRVNVAPVVGQVDAEGSNFIKVLIAYDVLVIVRPDQEVVDFDVKRNGKKITFTNKGNTNVLFRRAEQCPKNSSNPEQCKIIPGHRLYADTSFTQDLPFDTNVEYTYSVDGELKNATY